MRRLAVALVMLIASGCAKSTMWQKPGTTEQDYQTDSFNCEKQMHEHGGSEFGFMSGGLSLGGRSSIAPVPAGPLTPHAFDNCMVAHGWTPTLTDQRRPDE